MDANRAFDFIEFPANLPTREQLIGHDRLHPDRYHGSLSLKLIALTPVFISAGITAMGRDVGEASVPLLKVMGQNREGHPILQGTSIKGCIRSVYETITNSALGVEKKIKKKPEHMSAEERIFFDRKPQRGRRNGSLTPAELVFGAMGFQGLVSIADAVGDRPLELGHLPPMFEPNAGRGRKFYRHQDSTATAPSASDIYQPEPDKPPSPIQQAPQGTAFATTLRFSNLSLAQLGALLMALGQDADHRFALKLGAGKGKGLGSMAVEMAGQAIAPGSTLQSSRYLEYDATTEYLPESIVAEAIQAAHATGLIHSGQLARLQQILQHPEVRS